MKKISKKTLKEEVKKQELLEEIALLEKQKNDADFVTQYDKKISRARSHSRC